MPYPYHMRSSTPGPRVMGRTLIPAGAAVPLMGRPPRRLMGGPAYHSGAWDITANPWKTDLGRIPVPNLRGALGTVMQRQFGRLVPNMAQPQAQDSMVGFLGWAIVAGSVGISIYHGYLRNCGSLGWGLGWGLVATFFPIITPAVALAQGLGKPPGGKCPLATPAVKGRK